MRTAATTNLFSSRLHRYSFYFALSALSVKSFAVIVRKRGTIPNRYQVSGVGPIVSVVVYLVKTAVEFLGALLRTGGRIRQLLYATLKFEFFRA